MMGIHPALKCFNKRKCRFLTPCFYVCKRPVSISVKRGFYARKIPGGMRSKLIINVDPVCHLSGSSLMAVEHTSSDKRFSLHGAPNGFPGSAVPTLSHFTHGRTHIKFVEPTLKLF